MSVQSKPFYWLKCDACGVRSFDGDEICAWSDEDQALDAAQDAEWVYSENGSRHHCPDCPPPSCRECERDLIPGERERDENEPDMCVECATDNTAPVSSGRGDSSE